MCREETLAMTILLLSLIEFVVVKQGRTPSTNMSGVVVLRAQRKGEVS